MVPSRDDVVLVTLNTHSLLEPDTEHCLTHLLRAMQEQQVQILCLQEVNQLPDTEVVDAESLAATGFVPCAGEPPIREGNYALMLARRLRALGLAYSWTWGFTHIGYGKYQEGLSVFSLSPIEETFSRVISSKPKVLERYCERKAVGARVCMNGSPVWFYSVHLGWWEDENDPASAQIEHLNEITAIHPDEPSYLMGDFNNPAHLRGKGYDAVLKNWQDTYLRAEQKDDGHTVLAQIDGWRQTKVDPMRIDFIFTNRSGMTHESKVIFNNQFYPVISDHCGVLCREVF